ncbi:MAG TPA: hypothetical protein VNV66_11285, partial [Pilimelia sp.]|nr:hypothetical protein [Pilimelia sp.]
LAAANPWLVRYATETRMYSLVVLLVLVLLLTLDRVGRQPGPRSAAGLAAVSGALLLTHYWAMFLLAALGIGAVTALLRAAGPGGADRRRRALAVLAGLGGGGLLFAPWLPSLLFQLRHTGTPWARPPRPTDVVTLVVDWSSAAVGRAAWLALPVAALALLAVVRAARPSRTAVLAAWLAGTVLLAYAACLATASAFVSRYSAVVVPIVLLLVAQGLSTLGRRARTVGTAALCAAWVATSAVVVSTPRTQAGEAAAAVEARARPGDLVVYCPDQLGPSVSRELAAPVASRTYPDGAPPERVDWVDYRQRHRSASPAGFARDALAATPEGARIWLVTSTGYATAAGCRALTRVLTERLGAPTTVLRPRPRVFERVGVSWWRR